MSPREVLVKARELIATPDKWCQGKAYCDGAYCALGAIDVAGVDAPDAKWAAYDVLQGVTRCSPIRFNDVPSRTHGEVLEAFDAAIARCPS